MNSDRINDQKGIDQKGIDQKETDQKETDQKEKDNNRRIEPYIRRAKYYETDQMAVIHHSNYIRWFEEARVDFLEKIGLGYDRIEAAGVYSPVLGVSCEYKASVRFHEDVMIIPKLVFFNGIKMTIEYLVLDVETKQIKASGETKHCFVAKEDFRPVSLKKGYREMYEILTIWTGVSIMDTMK